MLLIHIYRLFIQTCVYFCSFFLAKRRENENNNNTIHTYIVAHYFAFDVFVSFFLLNS